MTKTLKGYRAGFADSNEPTELHYLTCSQSPAGPFISCQPEPPKPMSRAMVETMVSEWVASGFARPKLIKVYSKG